MNTLVTVVVCLAEIAAATYCCVRSLQARRRDRREIERLTSAERG